MKFGSNRQQTSSVMKCAVIDEPATILWMKRNGAMSAYKKFDFLITQLMVVTYNIHNLMINTSGNDRH